MIKISVLGIFDVEIGYRNCQNTNRIIEKFKINAFSVQRSSKYYDIKICSLLTRKRCFVLKITETRAKTKRGQN